METKTEYSTSTVVQAVVPSALAHRLKTRAAYERRSVSSVIRLAIEDSLSRRRDEGGRR